MPARPPHRCAARRSRFRYVDFAAAGQAGFRNHVVPVDRVPGLVVRYGAEECYASIFCFSDEILLYLAEHRVNGRPSIAGYDGRIWAPFLPLDLDAPDPEHLTDVLDLARRIHRLLTERWRVPAAAIHTYFSGAKGFHLLLNTRVFGRVAPSRHLHQVFSRLRFEVLRALPDAVRPLFDLAIGDKVRLLRLPNTRHRSSGLYKIPLTAAEVEAASAEDIRTLAARPRPLTRVRAGGLLPAETVAAVPAMVQMLQRARRNVRRARGPHPYRMPPRPAQPEEALCAARTAMWRGPVLPGMRNNAAIRLASAFRLAGYTHEDTRALLRRWNHERHIGLPEREVESVVHSAYARPYPYAYGCHDEVIRSFCPFVDHLNDCQDYRARHPRSQRETV